MAAEGGTNFNYMITIARSRKLWGTYEGCSYNPILTNLHDTGRQLQCSGHGGLLEDYHGNWWMVHLGIRTARRTMSHLGRETCLTPVCWEEEWPKIAFAKKARFLEDGPLWEEQRLVNDWETDFSRSEWEPQRLFLRKYRECVYKREHGRLLIRPVSEGFHDKCVSSFAAVRPLDFGFSVETLMEFCPGKPGEEAGMAVYLASDYHYRFGIKSLENGNLLVKSGG